MSIESMSNGLKSIREIIEQPFITQKNLCSARDTLIDLKKRFNSFIQSLEKNDKEEKTESTALIDKDADRTKQQLREIKVAINRIEKKIAAYSEALINYDNFKKSHNKPQPKASFPMFVNLPKDIQKMILNKFSLHEQLNLKLVSREFRRLINESWFIDEAVLFSIGDQVLIKPIQQPELINSNNAIKIIDILNQLNRVKPQAREHVIHVSTNEIEQRYFHTFGECTFNNPLTNLEIGAYGLAILLTAGILIALFKTNDFRIFYFFTAPGALALFVLLLRWKANAASSAYSNLRYGRFFSSEPITHGKENEGVAPLFSAASLFVVEVYPQVSVDADIESGATTDDEAAYHDANEELFMPRVDTAALTR